MSSFLPLTFVAPLVLLLAACSRPVPPPEPVRAVRTMVVSATTPSVALEYAAEVRARTESQLGFRVGGKLLRRDAEVGAAVKAGQRLAQLDPQDLQLGQLGAQAALASAQAELVQAEADFRRFSELRDQGFISSADIERRETTLKAARAQAGVQGNQAAYALLAADAAGVVTEVQAEPGQVLSAGQPVLRLAHDGPRDVVFAVPEDKISMLRSLLGRPGAIKVRLWGSEALLPGTVREVAAATDATTRTVRVKVDIGRATVTLGQTATVLIDVPQTQTAIKLPMSALTEVGGATSVWLLDGATMTVRPQAVQVGGAEGNLVLVAGGLLPGAEVVTAGVHVLTPGQVVRRYAGDADKARSDAQSGSAPAAVAAASR